MIPRQFGPKILMPSNLRCSRRICVLQLSSLGSDLAKAGRNDHESPGARLAALPHQCGYGRRRRANDRQVGGVRQARNVLVRLNPLNRLALRIDRINHAAKTGADQIPQYGVADAGRRVARANDCDAAGLENLVQVPDAHVLFLNGVVLRFLATAVADCQGCASGRCKVSWWALGLWSWLAQALSPKAKDRTPAARGCSDHWQPSSIGQITHSSTLAGNAKGLPIAADVPARPPDTRVA